MAGVPADFSKRKPSIFDNELTYRSSMLPLGTYRNDDGTESAGWAWPGMITEPINAMSRLAESFVDAEGNPALPNPQNPENQSDMLTALLSMYGGNAVRGMAKGSLAHDAGSTFSSRNASIFDPPSKPARPFEADYPSGARADEQGRLTHDIEGRPLTAEYVAGRRQMGGADEALTPAEIDAIAEGLFGTAPQAVPGSALPRNSVGAFRDFRGPDGPDRRIDILRNLEPATKDRVTAHELGHGVAALANEIPTAGLFTREPGTGLGQVYHDLNDASWRRGQPTPQRYQTAPDQYGYRGDDIQAENIAEAIRAYMADPNYLKTVAPKTAARVREYVNENPRLNSVIQFNADTGRPSLMGSALAGEYQNALDPYYRR